MEPFNDSDCDIFSATTGFADRDGASQVARGISIDKCRRLFREWLSKGTVVYGRKTFENYDWFSETERKATTFGQDTHTGIIVNIRAIEPEDSERKVLEDIIADYEKHLGSGMLGGVGQAHFVERARRLLSKRSEK